MIRSLSSLGPARAMRKAAFNRCTPNGILRNTAQTYPAPKAQKKTQAFGTEGLRQGTPKDVPKGYLTMISGPMKVFGKNVEIQGT